MQRKSFADMACPIARGLERVGEWWSMLILRDAFAGMTRFDEFQQSLGIAPNMLTRRLAALVESGLLERRRYSERPPRDEYLLTERGRDFRTGADRAARLGQPALRARGRRRRADRRQPDRRGRRADAGRPAHRPAAGRRRDFTIVAAGAGARPRRTPRAGWRAAAGCSRPTPPPRARSRAMSARRRLPVAPALPDRDPAAAPAEAMSPRTRRLLHGPIVPTLLRMAWPNILVMLAQASTGLIETWWVSQLGTDALAGMALVFPGFMMMQMLSAGAMGGGISSAIARALGAGRRDDADALVLHALIINLGCSACVFSALFLLLGPADLPRDGRRRRLARSGAALLQRRVRRQRAGLADERAGQR